MINSHGPTCRQADVHGNKETDMSESMNRREFVAATAAAGIGLAAAGAARGAAVEKPACLGGKKAFTGSFSGWPNVTEADEQAVHNVVHTGRWWFGKGVVQFQEAYAKLTGAKYCVATSCGTAALYSCLTAMDVGPGDEVLVPPYTFIATINVVLLKYALPVFVDTDRETFLMDPGKVDAAVTDRTKAIIPVHIGGAMCDLDNILAVAKKRNVPVLEDACQAHLGQWRGRSAGSWGAAGCFSFQVTKNLPSGEGGAIVTSDEDLANKCYAFHNCGRNRPGCRAGFAYRGGFANNLRMTEFQAAVLLTQMTRIEANAKTRTENAEYLSKMLREIPGITPARMYEGCTRNAYHLYMFRYDPQGFAGLPRSKFLSALKAEGVPCSGGYRRLNMESYIRDAVHSRGYRKIYTQAELDRWEERTACPANDKLCDEAVWFMQNMLLGPRTDMEQIAEAIRKIHAHAGELAKA